MPSPTFAPTLVQVGRLEQRARVRLARADGEYRLIVAAAELIEREEAAHHDGGVADVVENAEAELAVSVSAPSLVASRRLDQRARVPPASYDGEHRLIVAAT